MIVYLLKAGKVFVGLWDRKGVGLPADSAHEEILNTGVLRLSLVDILLFGRVARKSRWRQEVLFHIETESNAVPPLTPV